MEREKTGTYRKKEVKNMSGLVSKVGRSAMGKKIFCLWCLTYNQSEKLILRQFQFFGPTSDQYLLKPSDIALLSDTICMFTTVKFIWPFIRFYLSHSYFI